MSNQVFDLKGKKPSWTAIVEYEVTNALVEHKTASYGRVMRNGGSISTLYADVPAEYSGVHIIPDLMCVLCGHLQRNHGLLRALESSDHAQIEPFWHGCWAPDEPGVRCGCKHFHMGDPDQ